MEKDNLNDRVERLLWEQDVEESPNPGDAEYGTRTLIDHGDIIPKETSYTPEESMTTDWLWGKVHIQSQVPPEYRRFNFRYRELCDFVFKTLDRELFTTLNAIFFVYDKAGLLELERFTEDSYAQSCIKLDKEIGLMWYEYDIVIINVGLIQKNCEADAIDGVPVEDEIGIGIVSTLVHELRHLMVSTNNLLTELELPYSENTEEAVERFTQQYNDQHLLDYNYGFVEVAEKKTEE